MRVRIGMTIDLLRAGNERTMRAPVNGEFQVAGALPISPAYSARR